MPLSIQGRFLYSRQANAASSLDNSREVVPVQPVDATPFDLEVLVNRRFLRDGNLQGSLQSKSANSGPFWKA
jgi:hypothetical protein